MFTAPNVPIVLRNISLGFGEDAGQRVRLCKSTFRIPLFSYATARQIEGAAVAAHCFGIDGQPLWDVALIHIEPPAARYTITLRSAPDLEDGSAMLTLADIQQIKVWRPKADKPDLALEFVTLHELARGDARDLAEILTVWEQSACYATFAPVQTRLELVPPSEAGEVPAEGEHEATGSHEVH